MDLHVDVAGTAVPTEVDDMHVSKENIIMVLYECIDTLNEQLSKDRWLRKSLDAPLSDEGGLDSLGFVNLVALIEEACEERFGRSLVLTQGHGEQRGQDPFESVSSLAEYIQLALGRPH